MNKGTRTWLTGLMLLCVPFYVGESVAEHIEEHIFSGGDVLILIINILLAVYGIRLIEKSIK